MPTVLIADDDADHRELMTLSLKRFGHRVVEAANARDTRRVLAGGGVDALLLDVRMPEMSGIELCAELRAEPDTAHLPIMFVTADVNESRLVAALAAGADDYLTKPFPRAELATRLENLLLRRTVSPARSAAAALLAARHGLTRPEAPERCLHIA